MCGDKADYEPDSSSSRSEQAVFNMSNASSVRAGTIVFGGSERCQNLPREPVAMVTGRCQPNSSVMLVSSSVYVHTFTHCRLYYCNTH